MKNVSPKIARAINSFVSPGPMLYRFRGVLRSRCNHNRPSPLWAGRCRYSWEAVLTLAAPAVWEELS